MLKLSMWIGALILAGLVHVAQDVQDVLGRLWPPAFRITVLVRIDQYWSVVSELRGMGAGVEICLGA